MQQHKAAAAAAHPIQSRNKHEPNKR